MKKQSLIILFAFLSLLGSAQDTIIDCRSAITIASIIDTTSSTVNYKRFNFPDGPTYIYNKSELNTIRFSNGNQTNYENLRISKKINDSIIFFGKEYRYKNEEFSSQEIYHVLTENETNRDLIKLNQQIKKSNSRANTLTYSTLFAVSTTVVLYAGTFFSALSSSYQGAETLEYFSIASLVGTAAVVVLAIPTAEFRTKSRKQTKKAVRLYNQDF